jgi:16S rRNA (cytosine967-C5)-methyltransferase
MSFYFSYLNSAAAILQQYNGSQPFANFLKKYFAANKKLGSKDRRAVSALCYNYFRLGKSISNRNVTEATQIASIICGNNQPAFWLTVPQQWQHLQGQTQQTCISFFGVNVNQIFPAVAQCSTTINTSQLVVAHLQQPLLFLRVRNANYTAAVVLQLQAAKITAKQIGATCIAVPNNTNVAKVLPLGVTTIVQDYNSQQTLQYISNNSTQFANTNIWDCCAASGGKAILLMDILAQKANLFVTDIRASILHNLKQRFAMAGIKNYQSQVVNLTQPMTNLKQKNCALIICDAPCTGSGTWARTPEYLHFFDTNTITNYQKLQQQIITNTLPFLVKGGYFIYITCSVYAAENEAQVIFLQQQGCTIIEQQNLLGYNHQADSMFVAVAQKN